MPLALYISNDLSRLADKLASNLADDRQGLHQKEYFVVQTEGMSRWLAVKIAECNKIFTNFEFLTPNQLLYKLFQISGISNKGLFDTKNLRWIIYELLENKEFIDNFPRTFEYYKKDNIKRLQLATKTADLFDQYVIYRPDYIRSWNEGNNLQLPVDLKEAERWQKWLWIAIKKKYNNAMDKVEMRDMLLEKLKTDPGILSKIKETFQRISFFGLSIFTNFHIEVFLNVLKDIMQLDFYLFNPAPEVFWLQDIPEKTKVKLEKYFGKLPYEMDFAVGNTLLMNQAKTAKDMFLMLFEQEEFLNMLDNETLVKPPDNDTLLHHIQQEIYYNIPKEERKAISKEKLFDGSLTVASNFTELREIESLYNFLLRQIEKHNYEPKDILVLTPDIDKYSSYIKAVFDNAEINLPYTIADRSFKGNDNLIGILKQILLLNADEFTSENVVSLLEFDVIRRKFGINDLNIVRALIKEANIKRDISGDIENHTFYVSWTYGLEKILLGYAMDTGELFQPPGKAYPVLPLDLVEDEYAIEGLKLKYLVDRLIYWIEKRNGIKTLEQWKEYIVDMMTDLMFIGDNEVNDFDYIISRLSLPEEVSTFENIKMEFEVFSKALIDSLYNENRKSSFITGKVTFCSMIPMRSIPYKVIAILGLNKDSFPRQNKEMNFDLRKAEYRYGDRHLKESDKYLFFESIISAKEKLYLSYLGQNAKDNSLLPPSAIVDEVLDYIQENSDTDIRKDFVIYHPLSSTDKRYFDGSDRRLFTYLDYNSSGQALKVEEMQKEELEPGDIIKLDDLLSFYKNPVKWHFNKILKIYYDQENILLPDIEKFELDNLDKSFLKKNIIKNPGIIHDEHLILEGIIKGHLPLKNMSKFELESLKDEVKEMIEYFHSIKGDNEEKSFKIEIETANNIVVTGTVGEVYGDKMILINTAKDNSKALAILQIYRMISSIAALPVNKFILLSQDNIMEFDAEKDKEYAGQKMKNILDIYAKGHRGIIPFHPAASYMYLKRKSSKRKSRKDPYDSFLDKLQDIANYDMYIGKLLNTGYWESFRPADNEQGEDIILKIAREIYGDVI